MKNYNLQLFITGKTSRSEQAIKSLRKLCEEVFEEGLRFEVIDVLDEPEKAEENKVLATPTLIKTSPPPVKRLIGDFEDTETVKKHLDMI
jgi:circadian clock protein KaiB